MKRWLAIVGGVLIALLLVVGVLLFTPIADPDLSSKPQPAKSYEEAAGRIDAIKAAEDELPLIPESKSIALLTGSEAATSVVIFHGYTSVPQQFRTVAEGYRAQGYNVWIPRLPYHGMQNKMTSAFSNIDSDVARRFADKNVDIAAGLGRDVIVIGFSGGGSLGTWAATERPDVAKTILISPVLHPLGIPRWADRPLVRALRLSPIDVYKWWDDEKKADNTEGYNYPRLSLKGLAAMLSLAHWSENEASDGVYPAKSPVLLVRNDGDQRLDSEYNEDFARRIAAPADLEVKSISEGAGLLHNFISTETYSEGYKTLDEAYAFLSSALGIPLPDPTPTQLAESDNGGSVTLESPEGVTVSLPSNPSTGYSWQVAETGPLTQVGEATYTAPDTALAGAGGVETFRFASETPGSGTLTLEYRRPWETDVPAEKTWTAKVTVEPPAQ